MELDKQLANGVTVRYLDESKKLAADRWLVRLRAQASIPVQDWMRAAMAGDEPRAVFCRRELGDALMHEVGLERNFIDAGDVETVRRELVHGFESSVLSYLGREAFVRQLFLSRQAELTERYARQAASCGALAAEEDDEAPGPADFSDCFR